MFRVNLLTKKTRYDQHYWINIYFKDDGVVFRKHVFTRRRDAVRAVETYQKPSKKKGVRVLRIHVKPNRKNKCNI